MPDLMTAADQALHDSLREDGRLRYVTKETFPSRAFIFCCGDGHRAEQLEYLFRLMRGPKCDREIVPHWFTCHGGPLVLVPKFGGRLGREFLIDQLIQGIEMKPDIDSVILQPHSVCGAVRKRKLDLRSTLLLHRESKEEIAWVLQKREITTVTGITTTVHFDYGNDRMKTLAFDVDNFE